MAMIGGTSGPSKGPGFLQKLGSNIGQFLSSDAAPVVLGQAAQAVMGGTPEGRQSWQSGLGGVGNFLGQSNIAAKAAQRQAQERNQVSAMLAKALGGNIPYTEDHLDGATTSNLKMGSDGTQTFTMKGRGLVGGPTNPRNFPSTQQQGGATTQPSASPPKPSGNVRPEAPLQTPEQLSSLLPFYLAQAVTGSGGGGGNLFGLSPEQIGGIGRRDIAGQEMLNRTVGGIYGNLVRQAQTDYYNRMPQAKPVDTPEVSKMFKGADGNMWAVMEDGSVKPTDTPYQPGMEGGRPAQPVRHPYTDQQGRRRSGLFLDGKLIRDLGQAPETSVESGRSFGVAKDLGDIEARILEGKGTPQDMTNFNSRSRANYYYVPKEEGFLGYGDPYERVELPPGVTAADMYDTVQSNPDLTFEQILTILRGQ